MSTRDDSTAHVEPEDSPAVARDPKGKKPIMETPLIGKVRRAVALKGGAGRKWGAVGVLDFVVRLAAIAAAMAAAVAMGTTEETLPFFTQFFQFQASFDDLPTFTFFVVGNAISSGYLVLSLPFSVVCILRPLAKAPRIFLITFDTMAMTLTTAAAGSSAAIVYLAHNGSTDANWIAICQQFTDFCQHASGAVVSSFVAVVFIMLLIVLSALALKRH